MSKESVSHIQGSTFGERLLSAMKRAGVTKTELGRQLGKSYNHVHKWCTGFYTPGIENLKDICAILGVDVSELLGIAAGQRPSFEAWEEFLASPYGAGINEDEERALKSIVWPPGVEPTVLSYQLALQTVRSAVPTE